VTASQSNAMSRTLAGLISLLRLHHAPTAAADSVTGALLAWHLLDGGTRSDVVLVVAGSALLYSAGMVFNDVADVHRDQDLHPERPIPSGQVSVSMAFTLGTVLLMGGLVTVAFAGLLPLLLGGFISLGVLVYDFEATTIALWGPVLMGLLRSVNFLLGLSIAGSTMFSWTAGMSLALFTGLHIVLVTAISLLEERPRATDQLSLYAGLDAGLIVFLFLYLLLVTDRPLRPDVMGLGLLPLLIYGYQFGMAVRTARRNPEPSCIGKIVGTGVQGLIWMESAMLVLLIGPAVGFALLLLFVPILLGRWL